jgi:Spirocyclase AveC-like
MATNAAFASRVPVVAPEVETRRTRPVKFWALIGCLIWAFQIFVLIRWFTGPFFTPVHTGPNQPPATMKAAIIVYLVLQWTAWAALAYVWVVRPLRQERRLRFDGMFFLCWCGWYWFWDPIGNYYSLTTTYNTWLPNMGSWVNVIPGWSSPGAPGHQFPEPWIFVAGLYGVFMVGTAILGCWLLRKTRKRWPRMGTAGLFAVAYAAFVVTATLLEFVWMRIGMYTYLASPAHLPSFFPGHYYKYPAFEGLIFGSFLTANTFLRWSINDKGESFAERGASTLKARHVANQGLRLMSIVGFTTTVIFLSFFLPYFLIWSPHPEKVPLDIQRRSYFLDGICGPGTNRACPNQSIPLFTNQSITVTPDGKLYVPPGVKLPNDPTTFKEAQRRYQEATR